MYAIASSRSVLVGLSCLLAILSITVLPTTARAVSVANKDLTLNLLWDLAAMSVDVGGQRIQQVDARNRAEVAQCLAQVRDIAGRMANNEIEAQNRLPAEIRRQPSMWAPLVVAAQLAHEYATNAPAIQNSMSYRAMKQMEVARKWSQEMLKNPQYEQMMKAMGMDMKTLKQWADAETKSNLRTLIHLVCQAVKS
jgi:hypothetical protein